jgi:hypothetical protein
MKFNPSELLSDKGLLSLAKLIMREITEHVSMKEDEALELLISIHGVLLTEHQKMIREGLAPDVRVDEILMVGHTLAERITLHALPTATKH